MVISILTRTVRSKDRAQWQPQLAAVLPRIKAVLDDAPGFVSVEYLWGVHGEGETAQITTWQTLEDCQRYVRQGDAATVATLEEAAIPTAVHPDGRWVRQTYEVVEA